MALRPTHQKHAPEFGTGLRDRIHRNWTWRSGSPRYVKGLVPSYGRVGSKPGA